MKKLDALLKALLMVVLLGEQVFLLLLVQAITNCCALCALPHNNFTTSPDIISPILLLSSPSLSSMKRLESTSSRRSYGFDHQFGRKFYCRKPPSPQVLLRLNWPRMSPASDQTTNKKQMLTKRKYFLANKNVQSSASQHGFIPR